MEVANEGGGIVGGADKHQGQYGKGEKTASSVMSPIVWLSILRVLQSVFSIAYGVIFVWDPRREKLAVEQTIGAPLKTRNHTFELHTHHSIGDTTERAVFSPLPY
ncbi:hypothetical protein CSUI_008100 [Cystoisospora suis]|uniref:Transmembrane protein n=1 Tax=Cystoisospora suis TaxID=483139 RepID=A0A2C6KNM5_9APIC|nr:hypothetical protein CSUI_008100 [Cystoisospora suis]